MKRCELTDLPEEMCAHCQGWEWDEETHQYVKDKWKTLTFEGLRKGVNDEH